MYKLSVIYLFQKMACVAGPSSALTEVEKDLNDGGYTLIDTIIYKMKNTPNFTEYLTLFEIPKDQDNDAILIMRGLIEPVIRDPTYRVEKHTTESGTITYSGCLLTRYVEIEFTHYFMRGCVGYPVTGSIMVNLANIYMELSEKDGKLRLDVISTANMEQPVYRYDGLSAQAYYIFRSKIKKFEKRTERRVSNALHHFLGKAINRVLAKDEFFQ